jgi:hypothetical protein
VKALAACLLAFAGLATAQTPAPAPASQPQSQEAPAAPPKPLNLSLDPVDRPRARITFEPREDKKAPTEATLPGMGGERARTWEVPSNKVFPPDTNPNSR